MGRHKRERDPKRAALIAQRPTKFPTLTAIAEFVSSCYAFRHSLPDKEKQAYITLASPILEECKKGDTEKADSLVKTDLRNIFEAALSLNLSRIGPSEQDKMRAKIASFNSKKDAIERRDQMIEIFNAFPTAECNDLVTSRDLIDFMDHFFHCVCHLIISAKLDPLLLRKMPTMRQYDLGNIMNCAIQLLAGDRYFAAELTAEFVRAIVEYSREYDPELSCYLWTHYVNRC